MAIKMIVATDLNNAIGYNNELLFRETRDLRRFKELTIGHFVVMGRKTYESLPKGALPDRTNVVVTRNEDYNPKNPTVIVCTDISRIINHYLTTGEQEKDLWIIGGSEIYNLFLPYVSQIYLTKIHKVANIADSHFIELDEFSWYSEKTELCYSEKYDCNLEFIVYKRKE